MTGEMAEQVGAQFLYRAIQAFIHQRSRPFHEADIEALEI
jgi:hypothetical protein